MRSLTCPIFGMVLEFQLCLVSTVERLSSENKPPNFCGGWCMTGSEAEEWQVMRNSILRPSSFSKGSQQSFFFGCPHLLLTPSTSPPCLVPAASPLRSRKPLCWPWDGALGSLPHRFLLLRCCRLPHSSPSPSLSPTPIPVCVCVNVCVF